MKMSIARLLAVLVASFGTGLACAGDFTDINTFAKSNVRGQRAIFESPARPLGVQPVDYHYGYGREPSADADMNAACDVGCGCCGPKWRFRADAMFLDRTSSADTVLIRQAGTNNVLLDAGDLSFGGDSGVRLSLLRDVDCGAWEFSWLENQWDSAAQIAGPNDLNAVLGATDYVNAANIDIGYRSDLDSLEINRHFGSPQSTTWLAGFRYISLDEIFNMRSTAAQTSNYGIRTKNDLFGLQLGAHWQYDLGRGVSVGVLGKGGVYYAERNQSIDFRDNGNVATLVYRNEGNGAAFVGELDANITWHVFHWLALRGGFQYFWFQSVALAPEQFQGTLAGIAARPTPVDGGFDAYGGYLGAEIIW